MHLVEFALLRMRENSYMKEQVKDLAAVALIGDGVVGLLEPRAHCLHWRIGPKPFRRLIDAFVAHPNLTRTLAGIEAGLGIWLAARVRQ
jgi:hypothetical protein